MGLRDAARREAEAAEEAEEAEEAGEAGEAGEEEVVVAAMGVGGWWAGGRAGVRTGGS